MYHVEIIAKNSSLSIDFAKDDLKILDDVKANFKKYRNYSLSITDSFSFLLRDFHERSLDNIVRNKHILDYYSPNKRARVSNCNTYTAFAKFLDGKQEIKQLRSNACNSALLCPYCASRKAAKTQRYVYDLFTNFAPAPLCADQVLTSQNYNTVVDNTMQPNEHLEEISADLYNKYGNILDDYNWYYIVLTVKNGDDFNTVFNHLQKSFQNVRQRIKNYKKGMSDSTFFKIDAAFFSYETTYTGNGHHPHINLMVATKKKLSGVFCSRDPKQPKFKKDDLHYSKLFWNSADLVDEWNEITGDSFITSCTPLYVNSRDFHNSDFRNNLFEILKYSLKFQDLPKQVLLEEIYPYLTGRKLFGSLGFLYGIGLTKVKIEQLDVDDRLYREFFLNNLYGSEYTLVYPKKSTELVTDDEQLAEVVHYLPIKQTNVKPFKPEKLSFYLDEDVRNDIHNRFMYQNSLDIKTFIKGLNI